MKMDKQEIFVLVLVLFGVFCVITVVYNTIAKDYVSDDVCEKKGFDYFDGELGACVKGSTYEDAVIKCEGTFVVKCREMYPGGNLNEHMQKM